MFCQETSFPLNQITPTSKRLPKLKFSQKLKLKISDFTQVSELSSHDNTGARQNVYLCTKNYSPRFNIEIAY